MSYSLNFVKQVIEEFVTATQASSIELAEGKDSLSVNKSIFDIESYLVELRSEHKINNRLDTSIVSANILEHFNSVSSNTAYRPVDYQLNFLHHLAVSFLPDKDLFTLIDEFIDEYKHQFTLADIVLTETGATRCKTNIRFAVVRLRELGLVLSKGAKEKPSWAPAIMGLVALLNISFNAQGFANHADFKKPDSLLTVNYNKRLSTSQSFDPTLVYSIQMFRNTDHLYTFLTQLEIEASGNQKAFLENLIADYINFVEEGLEITENGIRTTKVFKEKSEAFQRKLFSIEEGNRELHAKLFRYFRK